MLRAEAVPLPLDFDSCKYNNFQMFRSLSLRIKLTPLFILVNIILFSVIVMIFRINILESKKEANRSLSGDLASRIDDYFKKKEEIVKSVSKIDHIINVSSGKIVTEELDFTTNLDIIEKTIDASVVYLMDPAGNVSGSSTYEESKTLIGENYKFRPYFRDAMKGENSFYTAVGMTTGQRGMYFGFPVRMGGKITGVIVVKFNLTQIDEIIAGSKLDAVVVSPDGIIFSASEKEWFFSMTFPLTEKKISEIKRSGQLGSYKIRDFSYDLSREQFMLLGEKYYVEHFKLKIPGWMLITFSRLNVKINYIFPFLTFIILMIIELLIINSVRDYRLKKASSILLMESRERFKYLFESAMDSILLLDEDGYITDVNLITGEMFGYPKADLLGKSFKIFFHGDSQNIYEKQKAKISVDLRSRFEFRGRKSDGKDLFVDCSIILLRGDDIPDTTYFVTCSDITDRKEAEALLKSAKDDAESANLSKSQFLANMSHEIRTPMNAIIGFSELLESSDPDEKQKEYIEIIKQSGESLLYLIDEIIDFSKIEAGKLQIEKRNFELGKILSEIEKIINIWIKNNDVTLSIIIEKDVPKYLIGDPERLKQILQNLLINAIKFTVKGTIDLKVSLRKDIGLWVSLKFSVKDTGIGISKGDTDKLFKSFSQIDSALGRKYEGTGLGLAITSKLVEMMGGSMKVESEVGKGSLFYFTINFEKADSPDEKDHSEEKERIGRKKDLSQHSLLVVEDNNVNRMLLEYMLKREGFIVTTAVSGVEALKLLDERTFDIILMDIQMPGMDGVEVTKVIRKTDHKNVPVIALTANAMKGDREKYISLGLDDYLSKPIKKRALLNTVIKWIIETKG